MKMKNLLTAFLTFTMALSAIAEVPSLINYQGRLTGLRNSYEGGKRYDESGEFKIKIFDQKTGGKLIYQEDIGVVSIHPEASGTNEGVYSFGFGENGHSILDFSENLIVEEAGKQVFDYALTKVPFAESLSIEAGDYNWNEKTGSSDAANLLVQYDKNNKSAKIIFLNGSPDKDSKLKFSYRIKEGGIIAAFASSQNNWLELTFGQYYQGKLQPLSTFSPRERLVSVPFALTASVALQLSKPIGETVFMKHGEVVNGGGNITESEIDIRSTTAPNSNLAGSWHYFQFRFQLLDNYKYLSFKTAAKFGYPSGVSLDGSMLKKINSSIYAYPTEPNGRFITDENRIYLTSDGFSQETQLINPEKGEYVIYFKMKKISEFPDLNKDISYHGPISVIVKGFK